jgi:hypothetical protein
MPIFMRGNCFELVVDDVGGVDLLVCVAGDDALGQVEDALAFKLQQHPRMVAGDFNLGLALAGPGDAAVVAGMLGVDGRGIAAVHLVAALATHGFNVDLLIRVAVDELEGRLENVGVEGSGKTLVAADDDEQDALLRARGKERMAQVAGHLVKDINASGQRCQHTGDHPGIRPGRQCPLLRAAQFRRRDHLHGLGDLPRVFHAADATP